MSVYSFSDDTVRVIQAYHESSTLVIRLSETVDLKTSDNMSNVDYIFRWMLSDPIGQTAFFPALLKENVQPLSSGTP